MRENDHNQISWNKTEPVIGYLDNNSYTAYQNIIISCRTVVSLLQLVRNRQAKIQDKQKKSTLKFVRLHMATFQAFIGRCTSEHYFRQEWASK